MEERKSSNGERALCLSTMNMLVLQQEENFVRDIIFILEVQSAVPRVLLEILRKIRQTMSDKDAGSTKTYKLVNLCG
jgi:hypothetical protein